MAAPWLGAATSLAQVASVICRGERKMRDENRRMEGWRVERETKAPALGRRPPLDFDDV